MEEDPYMGYTFDDLSLVTQYADFLPKDVDTSTKFSRNIGLKIPFISAAMDTVTEADMAIIMATCGGIGVVHKNMPVERQVSEVKKVKLYSNGLIQAPVVFNQEDTLAYFLHQKEIKEYKFSGFPIVDGNGILVGILTSRDLKFHSNFKSNTKIKDIMVTDLRVASEDVGLKKAFAIMNKYKVGKLPLVDKEGKLTGLYSFHDVKALNSEEMNDVNFDSCYQLRVAAAISPYDFERSSGLVATGVDALVIDTAHGYSKGVLETVVELKKSYGDKIDIIAGNIGSKEAAESLVKAGVDGIKVGIGPGSICTTRIVAGVGVPQLTAIYRSYLGSADVPIIADGGIKQSGDVAKALAMGASSVMMGSILAATAESPGEKIIHQGRQFVVYRGMGSLESMKYGEGSRERYSQADVTDINSLVPQGVEGRVLYRGNARDVLNQFVGGVKFSLGYCGSCNVNDLREKAVFVKVTSSGLREAHPHDIQIVKDAPNYRTS